MRSPLSPASLLRAALLTLLPTLWMCRPREPIGPTAADVTYQVEPTGPTRAPFTGTIERLEGPHALPFGFVQKKRTDPVQATPDYPIPGDASAVLGKVGFSIRSPQRSYSREDWDSRVKQAALVRKDADEEMLRRAAAMGANALYPAGDSGTYWALYVSRATPPPGPAPATLLRLIVPAGFTEISHRTVSFDDLGTTLELKAQRGHCYGISLALTENAQRTRSEPPRVGIQYKHMGVQSGVLQPLTSTMGVFDDSEAATRRASFFRFFCPVVDEPLSVRMSSSDKPPAGTGDLLVTLHDHVQSEAEARKTICHACGPANVECGNILRSACAPAVKCLAQLNARPTACDQ